MEIKYYYMAYTNETFKLGVINEVDGSDKIAIEVNGAHDAWRCGLLLAKICPNNGAELGVPRPEGGDIAWFMAPDGIIVGEFDSCPDDCSHYKLLERTDGKLERTYEKEV